MKPHFDVLSVGELLADLISTHFSDSLRDATHFERFQGGSPANFAGNLAWLGKKTALVASVGEDNIGRFLVDEIVRSGVNTGSVVFHPYEPTSIVVVSRTKATPDFIAYRTADVQILPEHLPDTLLDNARVFHTTCFALSQSPARETILGAAHRAAALGVQLSIDANYAPKIWPNRQEALAVVQEYAELGAFVKLSEDDAERLYGTLPDENKMIEDLLNIGAKLVCYTKGSQGSTVVWPEGSYKIIPKPVNVIDATGAGDAFWAGFIWAWLEGRSYQEATQVGTNLAAHKIQHLGPLQHNIDTRTLYDGIS